MKLPFAIMLVALVAAGAASHANAAVAAAVVECNKAGPPINSASLSLIKLSEGWRPSLYKESGPNAQWTVGFGHVCTQTNCGEVPYPIPLSLNHGNALLLSDLKVPQNCLAKAISNTIKLNANQYGALVSWTFSIGCPAMASSRLISRLNAGQTPNTVASEELPTWVRDGGQLIPGIVNRRTKEVALFKTVTTTPALPHCL